MKKLIIFGTHHEVQGVQGADHIKRVDDPDYKTLLEELMELHKVGFIFEELSGYGPSVASGMIADDSHVDMDSETTDDALAKSEPQKSMYRPKSKVEETAFKLGLEIQDRRESNWVRKIKAKAEQFESGLVICGLVHSLSVAFRLQTEGFEVHVYTYEPIKRLCVSYGMRPPAKPGVDDVPIV